jgi:hypothetical protein
MTVEGFPASIFEILDGRGRTGTMKLKRHGPSCLVELTTAI